MSKKSFDIAYFYNLVGPLGGFLGLGYFMVGEHKLGGLLVGSVLFVALSYGLAAWAWVYQNDSMFNFFIAIVVVGLIVYPIVWMLTAIQMAIKETKIGKTGGARARSGAIMMVILSVVFPPSWIFVLFMNTQGILIGLPLIMIALLGGFVFGLAFLWRYPLGKEYKSIKILAILFLPILGVQGAGYAFEGKPYRGTIILVSGIALFAIAIVPVLRGISDIYSPWFWLHYFGIGLYLLLWGSTLVEYNRVQEKSCPSMQELEKQVVSESDGNPPLEKLLP